MIKDAYFEYFMVYLTIIIHNFQQNSKMSDAESIQFRNKSISQLIQQLNNLGDDQLLMQPTTMIGIQDQQSQQIRRFRSRSTKSIQKSRTSHTQTLNNMNQPQQLCEFFLTDGSQKKYYYNQIVNELETPNIGSMLNKYQQNFNTSIVVQYRQNRFEELMLKIQPWIEHSNDDKCFYACFIEYRPKQAIDLLSGSQSKSMSLGQACEKDQMFYECTARDILRIKNISDNYIRILRINKKSQIDAQLRIILLPQAMLVPSIDNPALKIVKSQLSQIINYIKTNPNKKYQHINKLLPKRYPTTTAIAQILLYDSVNYIVNWVTDGKQNRNVVNGRFDFYDKLAGISNLVKRVQQRTNKRSLMRTTKYRSKSPKPSKQATSQTDINRVLADPKKGLQVTQAKSMNELEYCRSLQRKTHKYSIVEFDSDNQKLFPQTVAMHPPMRPQLNQSEAITILKAQHARQISQYHQTIQNLNQKILILTSDKGMSEIFTIHEREIMLLELKIDQLRKDISKLCSTPSKQKDTQNLKQIIKKLNDEIASHQKSNPSHKLSQGKIKMLQRQLADWKQKLQKSQIARKLLKLQLQAATNRLKIKDEQTKKLHQRQQKAYTKEDLSSKQLAILQQMEQLSKNGISKDNAKYLIRKFKTVLGDISQLRQTILQCHNFLVDLQDHIQSRLSQKDPDVVLDCNKFIRSYLLNNLNIF